MRNKTSLKIICGIIACMCICVPLFGSCTPNVNSPYGKNTEKPDYYITASASPPVISSGAQTITPHITPTTTAEPVPSVKPAVKATAKPTVKPTPKPTAKPAVKPTAKPTVKPTTKPTAKPTAVPTQNQDSLYQTTILGSAELTAEQMVSFLLKYEPNPQINCSVWQLAELFLTEGADEGVRGDIAFCQSILETGYFRFPMDVKPIQNNYAAMGATGGGEPGLGFYTPQLGVRAQIQHLKVYATDQPLIKSCIDPRYVYVTRGIAPRWVDLSGRWAVPGYYSPYTSLEQARANRMDYGSVILRLYRRIKETVPDPGLVALSKQ